MCYKPISAKWIIASALVRVQAKQEGFGEKDELQTAANPRSTA